MTHIHVYVPSNPGCKRERRRDLSDYDQAFDKTFKKTQRAM